MQRASLYAIKNRLTNIFPRLKEINFANIEKQELEDSIRADEDIVAGLERTAHHLADQIEITSLNRANMQSEVQRQQVRIPPRPCPPPTSPLRLRRAAPSPRRGPRARYSGQADRAERVEARRR